MDDPRDSHRRLQVITIVSILVLGAILVYFVYFVSSAVRVEMPGARSTSSENDIADRLLVTNIGQRMISEMIVYLPDEKVVIQDLPGNSSDHLTELRTDTGKAFSLGVAIRFQNGETVTHNVSFGGAPRGRCIELTVTNDGRVLGH